MVGCNYIINWNFERKAIMKFDGYKVLVSFENIDEEFKKEVHGKNIPKAQRKCIFCGSDTVKFNKIAHAVSETIGNKSLISHFECDECNEEFGKKLEDDLGKYMLPYKIIAQIFGKKNQLTSKDLSNNDNVSYGCFRIQVNKNKPVLEEVETKGMIIEKKDTGILKEVDDGFEITILRQHYNPLAVYCSFLKMAYSIMPLEFYVKYLKHIVLLKQIVAKDSVYCNEEKEKIMKSNPNCGIFCFFPGINPLGGINVILWQKTNSEEKSYPEMLFTLEMKNFSFTIPVLADEEQGTFKMPKFSSDKEIQYESLDFSKEELEFKCIMNAKKIEIEDYASLEEKLRNHKLLRQ